MLKSLKSTKKDCHQAHNIEGVTFWQKGKEAGYRLFIYFLYSTVNINKYVPPLVDMIIYA